MRLTIGDDVVVVGIDEGNEFQGFVALPGDVEEETGDDSSIVVTDIWLESEEMELLNKIREDLTDKEEKAFRSMIEKVIFGAFHLTPVMRAKAEE